MCKTSSERFLSSLNSREIFFSNGRTFHDIWSPVTVWYTNTRSRRSVVLQWRRAQPSKETKRAKMQQVMENKIPLAAHTCLPKGNHRRLSLELCAPSALASPLNPHHTFLTAYQLFLSSHWCRTQANKLCELITFNVHYNFLGLKQKPKNLRALAAKRSNYLCTDIRSVRSEGPINLCP